MWLRLLVLVIITLANAAAQPAETLSIVVEPGEQIGSIAQRYLKSPAYRYVPEVAKLNHLKPPYTIWPGESLLLPIRLMAAQTAPAKWIAVTGQVRIHQKSGEVTLAKTGGSLVEGERVVLGADASAVLELADASQIKLLEGTEFVMEESRYYKGRAVASKQTELSGTSTFSGLMRLIQGAVETRATKANDRAKPLRIQTPTAVVGVRGTDFRVSHSEATRVEVTQGLVRAQLDEARKADVAKDFGIKLDAAQTQMPAVVPLLNAPVLADWSLKQEKLALEFPAMPSLQDGKKVLGYRVQVASDEMLIQTVSSKFFPSEKVVRIPGLEDGVWHVAVRAVDEQGIEGKDAQTKVVLKARPQPSLMQTPRAAEKITQGQDVNLSWIKLVDAQSYVIEIQDEKTPSRTLLTADTFYTLKDLAVGTYRWRIATQVKKGQGELDTGPWSDARSFVIVATPEPAKAKLGEGAKKLDLSWEDQKAQKYELQLSRDASFDSTKSPVLTKVTNQPDTFIQNPETGKNFIRYRAIEEDGFVSSWSPTMEVDVPINWTPLWIFLGLAALIF